MFQVMVSSTTKKAFPKILKFKHSSKELYDICSLFLSYPQHMSPQLKMLMKFSCIPFTFLFESRNMEASLLNSLANVLGWDVIYLNYIKPLGH